MDQKKVVLILFSLVFLIGISFAVSAVNQNLTVVNIDVYHTNVAGSSVTSRLNYTQPGGVFYLKGGDNVNASGGNYTINITLKNGDSNANLTHLNITLPKCMEFINGTDETNASTAGDYSFRNYTVATDGTIGTVGNPIRLLTWNRSGGLIGANSSNPTWFWTTTFGFSVNISSSCNIGNHSINISGVFTNQTASAVIISSADINMTGDPLYSNYSFTIDNTAPRIENITVGTGSAGTTREQNSNASTVYIFFNEKLNGSGTVVTYNNWSVVYIGQTYNVTTAEEYTSGTWANASESNSVLNLSLKQLGLGLLTAGGAVHYNATPTVTYLNFDGAVVGDTKIQDLAGNLLADGASDQALDKIPPVATTVLNYSDTLREAYIEWTEPMNDSFFNGSAAWATHGNESHYVNLSHIKADSITTSGNKTIITFGVADRNVFAAWSNFSIKLFAEAGEVRAFKDKAGANYNLVGELSNATVQQLDKTNPTLTSVTIDANTNNITLVFSEAMNFSSFTTNETFLVSYLDDHNLTVHGINATNITPAHPIDYTIQIVSNTTIIYTLENDAALRKISYWTRSVAGVLAQTYLYISTDTTTVPIMDLANNPLDNTTLKNTSTLAVTWTKDTTAPTILAINWSNKTLNARSHTGLIDFSDEMNEEGNITVSITIGSKTYIANSSSITNQSRWEFTLTPLNDSTYDGVKTITLSGAKDDYNVSMAEDTRYTFTFDSTPPKILYAYMDYPCFGNDTTADRNNMKVSWNNLSRVNMYGYIHEEPGSNGIEESTMGCWPSIMLKFTENLSGDVSGISQATFNLSVTDDNLSSSTTVDANFSINRSDLTLLNITLNSSVAWITIRGRYNESLVGSGNSSGIDISDLNLQEHDVVDVAGNPAIPNVTAIDIADGLVTIPASGTDYYLSLPGCVDSLETYRYLSTVSAGACSEYLVNGWDPVTNANFQPLTGYRCSNFASALDLPLYVKKASQCTVAGSQVTLTQGWNLLGVDGWDPVSNATTFFNSLSSGGDISIIWKDVNKNSPVRVMQGDTGSNDFGNLTIMPFNAYWIFTDFSTSTKNFVGRGIY